MIACPLQTIILLANYYRFSASQSEVLLRNLIQRQKPDRQENRRVIYKFKQRLGKFVIIRLMIIIKIFSLK